MPDSEYRTNEALGSLSSAYSQPPREAPGLNGKPHAPTHTDDAGYELTEMGNAHRLMDAHRGDIYYSPALGWCAYAADQGRWLTGEKAQLLVRKYADETVQSLLTEATQLSAQAAETNKQGDKAKAKALAEQAGALLKWAIHSQTARMVTGMLEVAEPHVVIDHEQFNAHSMLLNCPNGTVELAEGRLREHRREDLLTQQTRIRYNPEAMCPTFLKFFDQITLADEQPERQGLVRYLGRLLGYALTGDTSEQLWHLLLGVRGENGKTTLVEVIEHVLADYACTMEPESITLQRGTRRSGSEATPDVARLHGKRFVKVTETAEGARIDAARVKKFCGEDELTGRHLYREIISFRPVLKLFVYTNHRPQVWETTHAFWRRVRVVPFDLDLKKAGRAKDKKLPKKLQAEAEGILAWLVEQCRDWVQYGLGETPKCIDKATEAYRSEMDVIAAFLDQCCELGPTYREFSSALYSAYCGWIEEQGQFAWSMTRFGTALNERGIERVDVGVKMRLGIRLKIGPYEGAPKDDSSQATQDTLDSLDTFPRDFP